MLIIGPRPEDPGNADLAAISNELCMSGLATRLLRRNLHKRLILASNVSPDGKYWGSSCRTSCSICIKSASDRPLACSIPLNFCNQARDRCSKPLSHSGSMRGGNRQHKYSTCVVEQRRIGLLQVGEVSHFLHWRRISPSLPNDKRTWWGKLVPLMLRLLR